MSANRLFLVCYHHQSIDEALCLAERDGNDAQYLASSMKRADDWYAKHARCGVDCYQLAYHRPQGWDISPDATNTPAGAVRMALINGESH